MGIFDRLRGKTIEAQAAPQLMTDAFNYYLPIAFGAIPREEAMTVPSVARCRNLIAGTIATFPLELYKKSTGEELGKPVWLEQPAVNQSRSVTIACLGSLITFQGLDEGVLQRGARTLRSAIDLETASRVATSTPMPSGVLKNTGADLSQEEVTAILAAWKAAREKRSTAYLTSTLEYQPTAFSPRDMMFVDAIQQMSTQVARMMNVPAYYISADQNTSMTYANVQDERRQFVSLSLAPYVHAIQDRLSMDDITARGNIVKFDVEDAFLAVNALERLAVIEKMLALGLITVDQAMEMENLSPNGNNDAPDLL